VVDDTDTTIDEYRSSFEDIEVVVFDKLEASKTFDQADNFTDMRAIVYARNACFDIARDMGVRYFIQLDDDYNNFEYRFDDVFRYFEVGTQSLDEIFAALVDFLKTTPALTIALSQNGDFIGGKDGSFAQGVQLRRKAMNSFVCDTQNPIGFIGRINEDVNVYTLKASRGDLFFTTNQASLCQTATQQSSGGMTDLYLEGGTYIKSFYSVMMHPSSIHIAPMGPITPRLHHKITWSNTVPKILRESTRRIKP